MKLVTPGFREDDANAEQRPAAPARPQLRGIDGGEDAWASAGDREMIEATVAAVGLIAAKWKVEVLYLLAARIRRHGRLHDHLLVSKKVLSETLRTLERDGLVSRRVFDDVPPRVEYSLTPLGRTLTGPLLALSEWTDEHLDEVLAAREAYDRSNRRPVTPKDSSPRFTAGFQIRRHARAERRLDAA